MPEHLRALIVILLLAGMVFAVSRRPAEGIMGPSAFVRRRNAWLALILIAFFAHSFWIYAAVAGVFLGFAGRQEQNRVALFFALLFALPPATTEIPGLGLVNYLFALSHSRLLSLIVLLPAFFLLRRQEGNIPFGRLGPDRLLAAYLLLRVALELRETTPTDTMREALHVFLDVFLPYYVVSRGLRNMADFRDAMLAFVLASLVVAAVGIFEFLRHWLLYSAVLSALGLPPPLMEYLERGGLLRARATAGHPIALGYLLAVAIGCFLFVKERVHSSFHRWLGGILLAAGLVAPLSRGPWVGTAALLGTYLATGPFAARRIAVLLLAGLSALPLLALVPGTQHALDFLPFVGTIEKENIDYRQQLLTNALVVIERNPWLGSATYLEAPEMEAMRQGQGIIDVVNTYVAVTLERGLVGLGLFIGFFLLILFGILNAMRSLPGKQREVFLLGRSLFAALVAILVIIFTVSSVGIIPIVYWSVAGLGVAYIQMVQRGSFLTGETAT